MRESDFAPFCALLDDVAALLMRPGQALTATQRAMYFRALHQHPLDAVRAALDAHVQDPQRGRFFPTPADVIAQLQGAAADDGRPGSDEAWAGALAAADEDATIVWTDEMAQAWFTAQPVYAIGDKIGARMAFREAYDRLVDEARKARRPVHWQASLGHDPTQRADTVRQAVDAGKLPEHALLPAPGAGVPLLELVGGSSMSQAEQQGRAALRELRNRLAQQPDEHQPGADGLAKAHTRRRADEIAQQVAQHLAEGNGLAKAGG